jgi:hypothetical protein
VESRLEEKDMKVKGGLFGKRKRTVGGTRENNGGI